MPLSHICLPLPRGSPCLRAVILYAFLAVLRTIYPEKEKRRFNFVLISYYNKNCVSQNQIRPTNLAKS
jgi:hypothetical protein